MNKTFHQKNRQSFAEKMAEGSLFLLFSGEEVVKTNDEAYPFFADRSFVYMTGIHQKNSALFMMKADGKVTERLYLLPPDDYLERWTGSRLKPDRARELSGVEDIRNLSAFESDVHTLLMAGHYSQKTPDIDTLYLDLYKADPGDRDRTAQSFLNRAQKDYPHLKISDAGRIIKSLRLLKTPEEIEAMKKAEEITKEGILAQMKISKPGLYEYQYKAEFDRALGQYGPEMHGFPPIISAGKNNFCIHYYSYTGRAEDGDLVLNDVGAQWDDHITDVSRTFPVNGCFTDRQKLLYNCALHTSDHMFEIVKPGLPMPFIDQEIRRYNALQLIDAGVLDRAENIGTYMWHGGSHHVGYDVHDVVKTPELIAPGMVFCIDVGIYHEEWGIGFRLEDNLLVTEDGCECLSSCVPRTIEDIESIMN